HTRWPRDWSSDVCSSDLAGKPPPVCVHLAPELLPVGLRGIPVHLSLLCPRGLLQFNLAALTLSVRRRPGASLASSHIDSGPFGSDRKSTRLNSSHVAISY